MDTKTIISQLVLVANGTVLHAYDGLCPDSLVGHDIRDVNCPACQALIAAEQVIGGCEPKS